MSHSTLFRRVMHALRAAEFCNEKRVTTSVGLEMLTERVSRRDVLLGGSALALSACYDPGAERRGVARSAAKTLHADVAIVGAGFAGLACADALAFRKNDATLYEASERVGGRCWSLGGAHGGPVAFPGQVVERGGELIDNLHKTLLGYANQLGLVREDLTREPGDEAFYFGGQHHAEEAVVEQYRDLVAAMHVDLNTLGAPTADSFTPADEILDFTSLDEYLATRGAGPLVRAVLDVAYNIEYGLEISEQSCLNLLLFMHADKRSRFEPFGVFSDERFHIAGGNEAIIKGLADRIGGPIHLGHRLLSVRKLTDGRIELTFDEGGNTVVATHDAVVLALPFSVLRDVDLDPSLGLPPSKIFAIDNLRYGTNAKLMLGFESRPWLDGGHNGLAYADLPNLQCTWESNPAAASATRGVLTNYYGGDLGAGLDPNAPQLAAEAFTSDLDLVFPGAAAAATRLGNGTLRAHLEHWPSSPFTKGSYTCNHPGYFTTIADNEKKPVDNLYFAGEHTSSFYEWQGFMEGAALSGIRAADEIWRDFR